MFDSHRLRQCLVCLGAVASVGVTSAGAQESTRPLVVVDAGHGGRATGAQRSGLLEKDVNLRVARQVEAALRSSGFDVLLTRLSDSTVSLEDRVARVPTIGVAALISIHTAASPDTTMRGIGILMPPDDDASRSLALAVARSVAEGTSLPVRAPQEASLLIFRGAAVPRVVIEIGHITNTGDASLLGSTQYGETIARALASAMPRRP